MPVPACRVLSINDLIAVMAHTAYFLMKQSIEELGPVCDAILSEPLGAYIWHEFGKLRDERQDHMYKNSKLPTALRPVHQFDLGAGNLIVLETELNL